MTKIVNLLLYSFSVNIYFHYMTVVLVLYTQHQKNTVLQLVPKYVPNNGILPLTLDMVIDYLIVMSYLLMI